MASSERWLPASATTGPAAPCRQSVRPNLNFPSVSAAAVWWRVSVAGGGLQLSGCGYYLQAVEACTQSVIVRAASVLFSGSPGRAVGGAHVEELVTSGCWDWRWAYEDLNDHDTLRRDALLAAVVGKCGPDRGIWVRAADRGSALALVIEHVEPMELNNSIFAETDRYVVEL